MTGTIQQLDFSTNLLRALLWQHDNAPRLKALLAEKQAWYDDQNKQFWTDWMRDVFDLRTANPFGLSVWAIILGQPIVFSNVSDPSQPAWGVGTYHRNFGRGNFASGRQSYELSMETARVILRLRYYRLIGTVQAPAINRALKDVFFENYGPAFVTDLLNMKQMYIFGFVPPTDMQFAFNHFDVLPRPSTVGSQWKIVVEEPWAFGPTRQNFGHGNFTDQ